MRKAKRSSSFILFLLLNMLLNWEGLIPAVLLLALHFWLDISFLWSVFAVIIWLAWIMLWSIIIGWAGQCSSSSDIPKENKNPYSVGNNFKNQ